MKEHVSKLVIQPRFRTLNERQMYDFTVRHGWTDCCTVLGVYLFIYLFICFASPTDEDLRSVAVIVTRTHIALAEENPQWPIPRYMDPPSPLKGPEFVCVAKHKITDVTSLVSNTRNRS